MRSTGSTGRRRRTTLVSGTVAALGALALSLGACGASTQAGGSPGTSADRSPSAMMTMPDGTVMRMDDMPSSSSAASPSESPTGAPTGAAPSGDASSQGGPSAAATLVCSEDEVAEAVQHGFGLSSAPTGSGSWDAATRLYTCRYPLPHSVLTLEVKDLSGTQGRDWFLKARHRIHGATPIHGLENLGFPAFQDRDGHVGFLKDGKTLLVDASSVAPADTPAKSTKTELAYGVAAAVIACWSEN